MGTIKNPPKGEGIGVGAYRGGLAGYMPYNYLHLTPED